jgi:transcriptional regulator with XRE-family HTH domain
MQIEQEIRSFLMDRRARITPEQAGLPYVGGRRRVPGLRREEVAMLAGVSVEYYTRLERGKLGSASDSVLEAIAGVLRLNDDEYAHLRDLARNVTPTGRVRAPHHQRANPINDSVQQVLDSMSVPAVVQNERLDMLAANRMGCALYSDLIASSPNHFPNFARYAFLDPRSESFYEDTDASRDLIVAALRSAAGHDPADRALIELIGSLSACSQDFAKRWAKHNVQRHSRGRKLINHPFIGRLDLEYNDFALPGNPDISIVTYTAAPGSASADNLTILDTWASTQEESVKTLESQHERGTNEPKPSV